MPIEAAAAVRPDDFFRRAGFWALFGVVAGLSFSISIFEITTTALIVLCLLSVIRNKNFSGLKDPFFIIAAVYMIFNIVSLVKTGYWPQSVRGVLKAAEGVALCAGAYYVIDSEEKFRAIFQWFLVVAMAVCLDAVFQGLVGTDLVRGRPMTPYHGDTMRLTGPFHHANDFSAYLSIVFFLFLGVLHEGRKVFSAARYGWYAAGSALVLGCLLGTYARGAWVAVGAASALFAAAKRSRVFGLLLGALVLWIFFFSPPLMRGRVISIFDSGNNTIGERRELWGEAGRMIEASPLIGLGVNTYSRNEPIYKNKNSKIDAQYAHNGYLQMAAEIGLLGLASFLALLFYFLAASYRAFSRTNAPFVRMAGTALVFGVLSFLIHSAADTNLQSLLLVNMLWMVMGVAWAGRRFTGVSVPGKGV